MQKELGETIDFEQLKLDLKTCIEEQFQNSFPKLDI